MAVQQAVQTTWYGQDLAVSKTKVQISVVVPMYNVETYLPELLDSFNRQSGNDYELEFIFVDDGSPDKSGAQVHVWMSDSEKRGAVIEQPNGGVGSARNAGMELATGDWIAFPDPDDFLNDSFFQNLSSAVSEEDYAEVNVVAANLHRYAEVTGEVSDDHPMNFKFVEGNRIVNLDRSPRVLQLSAATAIFRTCHLRSQNIRFSTLLRASEDAIFVAQVLLTSKKPLLGINADSIYFYRKRVAGTSALDTLNLSANAYFDRFRYGYLALFEEVNSERGEIPNWLMTTIMYEFRWLFGAELSIRGKETVLGTTGRNQFLELATELLDHVTREAILGYRSTGMSWEIRLLLLALKGVDIPDPWVYVTDRGHENGMLRLKYWFVGELPVERFVLGGKIVTPSAAKTQSLDYFKQQTLKVRHIWLTGAGELYVELDGSQRPVALGGPRVVRKALAKAEIDTAFAKSEPLAISAGQERYVKRRGLRWHLKRAYAEWYAAKYASKVVEALSEEELYEATGGKLAQVRRAAWLPESVSKYGDAWVFMDRMGQAQDNAEHLYRWVRDHSPNTNIWYVIERNSFDWERLSRDGFNLVPFRSLEHFKLILNTRHLISSHIDYDVVEPIPRRFYVNSIRPWKFTFLQHGVTHNDISLWLNEKKIDLFVTSTLPEFQSIAGDNSNYRFTEVETKRTGMPRFDSLLRKSEEHSKNVLLIAPTWRKYLLVQDEEALSSDGTYPKFKETNYYQNWQAFLGDDRLLEYARAHELEIVLLPHPNLAALVETFEFPKEIRIASYDEGDVQELFSKAEIAITDYSSVAFDLVYAGARLAYFQFDLQVMYGSGQAMREGTFSYERDGLGPVANDLSALFVALDDIAEVLPVQYQERIDILGWDRDGKACRRVYDAIVALDGDPENAQTVT